MESKVAQIRCMGLGKIRRRDGQQLANRKIMEEPGKLCKDVGRKSVGKNRWKNTSPSLFQGNVQSLGISE